MKRAVSRVNTQRAANGLLPASTGTSSYAEARARLPEELVHRLYEDTAKDLQNYASRLMIWRGRDVKLVDGSTLLMADTPENQQAFPQMASQEIGSGFPIARIATVFSLATGASLGLEIGPYKGKGTGEIALAGRLLHCFHEGDIVLGDAYYASYFIVALLKARGCDVVFEGHGARHIDFRLGKKLGPKDHLVEWEKPTVRPEWLDEQTYALIPDKLIMRESQIRFKKNDGTFSEMHLVTTMHDDKKISKQALSDLYKKRWNVEIDLRMIKSILGMDMLRSKTPEMVRKEIWIHLLAYNIIRKIMAEAAKIAGVEPRGISFKGTIQILEDMIPLWKNKVRPFEELYPIVLKMISTCKIYPRPNRSEPRAVKRRPKPFPRLHGKRSDAKKRGVSA